VTARGRLTVYSAAERQYCAALIEGFERRHAEVELDFVFGISTALQARYLAEHAAGGATADLVWSSAMDQQMGLVLAGHAQPHGLSPALPPGAAYRDLAIATTCEPLHSLSRGTAGAPAGTPAEVADLIEADTEGYRDRIALPDIEANGLGFLAMLRASQEDPAFGHFLAALSACRPRAFGSAPALVAAVAGGGARLALHVLGSYASRAAAADPALHLAPSAAPALAVSRIAFIPLRAANPSAGAAFLAHLLSPEGQAALGAGGFFPITQPPPVPLAPIPIDDGFARLLDPAARAALLARWRAALGRGAAPHGGTP
jgi:iron(III) transport system substrate-binding protein